MAIKQALDAVAARQERARWLEAIGVATARVGGHDPLGEYRRQAQQLIIKYGAGADLARMDWMIAVDMATSRRFTQQDIERGIARGKPWHGVAASRLRQRNFTSRRRRSATK